MWAVTMLNPRCRHNPRMVEPHPDWNESSDGYEADDVGIFVEPAIVQAGEGHEYMTSAGIDDADANAYIVELWTSIGTASETWDSIAEFAERETAWTFAAILTRYVEHHAGPEEAKSNLLHADPHYQGEQKEVPAIVEDLTAAETFRRLVHPYPVPDAVKAALEG